MGKDRKYILALVGITLVVVIVRLAQPKPVDWSEGYSASEKKPFGTYILHQSLPELFPKSGTETLISPIYEYPATEKNTNFIYINTSFSLDEFEATNLLNRVKMGHQVFIAVRQFDNALADSLNIKIRNVFPGIDPSVLSLDSLTSHTLSFSNPNLQSKSKWNFPVYLTESYFTSFDTSKTTVLGYIDGRSANYIKIDIEKGSFFIHTNPFLFTNYFLRDTEKYDYAFRALSYLSDQTTYWDEYYKVGRLQSNSPMIFIATEPSLQWAWFLGLFGLIVYLFFGGKRVQRIIPVIRPPKNTRLEFAETIANLYMANSSHKEIAEKKVRYFFDYLRTNLQITISRNEQPEELHTMIAQRSGVPLEHVDSIFKHIEELEKLTQVNAAFLKQLNSQIDHFYKNTQR